MGQAQPAIDEPPRRKIQGRSLPTGWKASQFWRKCLMDLVPVRTTPLKLAREEEYLAGTGHSLLLSADSPSYLEE
jgi:hypothetical protein